MPELSLTPIAPAGFAVPPQVIPKSKDDIEKYASIIREINGFANSDVGKQLLTPLIQRFAQSQRGPNGFVGASQGDHKPMPIDSTPTSPFFNGDKPGKRVGPAGGSNAPPQVVIQHVPTPVPLELSAADQYSLFMGGLTELTKFIGEEKSLKEAIEWATEKKDLIISMRPPLRINPPTNP
jgi:hypothetical protein